MSEIQVCCYIKRDVKDISKVKVSQLHHQLTGTLQFTIWPCYSIHEGLYLLCIGDNTICQSLPRSYKSHPFSTPNRYNGYKMWWTTFSDATQCSKEKADSKDRKVSFRFDIFPLYCIPIVVQTSFEVVTLQWHIPDQQPQLGRHLKGAALHYKSHLKLSSSSLL